MEAPHHPHLKPPGGSMRPRHVALIVVAAIVGIGIGAIVRTTGLGAHGNWGSINHTNRTADDLPNRAKVSWVTDGDTYQVTSDGKTFTVRVIGVDAPELAHDGRPAACHGAASSLDLRKLIKGRTLQLRTQVETHDKYDRNLADATFTDGPHTGQDLATLLAKRGDARSLTIPPNDAHAPRIAKAVDDAVTRDRGLWTSCTEAAAFPTRPR